MLLRIISAGVLALERPGIAAHIVQRLFGVPVQQLRRLFGVGVVAGHVAGTALGDHIGHLHAGGALKAVDDVKKHGKYITGLVEGTLRERFKDIM